MRKLLHLITIYISSVSFGQVPVIAWQKSFGGSGSDYAQSIQQTTDGGYIVAGWSTSIGGDVTGNNGGVDYWIVKLDANGNITWQKSLGGTGGDHAYSIQQTTDGGYIVAGNSTSNDGDVTGFIGSWDYWIVKLDANGNITWQKSLGGSNGDEAYSIQQTTDGGYIVAGWSLSNDGNVTGNNGSSDYWIVKLDATGNITWQKSLGGSGVDFAYSIQQTTDGGYIVAGYSNSNNGDVTGNNGSNDFWIVKLDTTGNITWQKSFGGSGNETAWSIHQTIEGGYIVAGWSLSNDGNVTGNNGSSDCWIVKLDASGNIISQKSLGGSNVDAAYSIHQTTDGGYIVAGWSDSNDGDVTVNNGNADFWIVKLIVPNIQGQVFNDYTMDCNQDNLEAGIEGINLTITPGNYIVTTDNDGLWYLDSLPVGTYTVTLDTTNLNWSPTCPVTQTFTVTDPSVFTPGPDFGLINDNPCTSPNVSVYAPFLRRCFSNQVVYVQACNEITATGILNSSYAEIELDPNLTVTSSSLPYTSMGNNLYSFDLGDLYPGQCVNFTINTTVSCNTQLGQTLCMDATLYPIESCVLDTIPSNPVPPTSGNNPDLVMPQPCTLPWDNSSLQVEGWCLGDSVQFSITNTGDFLDGDMDCYSPVFIYVNDTLIAIDSVQLQGQETVYYTFPSYGETWILHADQHPLHPGNSEPNAHVELCGSDSSQWIPDLVNNQPLDDADPVVDIYCGVVTGSYDPNDKRGFPTGMTDDHLVLPNQQLQYVIRFQNTGTDTAFTVVIRDTLDTDLNIFTVTPGVSSHNYTFQMYGPRVLEWKFDNILLPDSTTNEPESNGFVTFTVDQVPNLPNGTLITNEADIYFDFNDPIITNETTHLIDDRLQSNPLGIKEITSEDGTLIKVYPNPNNGMIFIELENQPTSVDYVIYGISGRVVLSGKLTELKNPIDIQKLNAGIYLIQISESETVKIVKE